MIKEGLDFRDKKERQMRSLPEFNTSNRLVGDEYKKGGSIKRKKK